ncbi:MAG: hypothetical protein D6731_13880 [Planctomycetota bacterium]|nr:MAG: hypothetical protein D6731_13880 [Planctomycetota bacterium]
MVLRRRARCFFLLALGLSAGCRGGGFFVARPTTTSARPRVVVANESPTAIALELEGPKLRERVEVPPWEEHVREFPPGAYEVELLVEGRTEFRASWYVHRRRGTAVLRPRTRYFFRYRPR